MILDGVEMKNNVYSSSLAIWWNQESSQVFRAIGGKVCKVSSSLCHCCAAYLKDAISLWPSFSDQSHVPVTPAPIERLVLENDCWKTWGSIVDAVIDQESSQ